MATNGPDPTPCDSQVYKKGTVVFITHTIPSNAMERWVQSIAADSGQQVDWHFVGGRAVVKALGDLEAVSKSVDKLMPEHDRLYKEAETKLWEPLRSI